MSLPLTFLLVLMLLFSVGAVRLQALTQARFGIPTTFVFPLVGVIFGPLAFDLVNVEVLAILQPFLSVLLGLIGFGMGLMLRHELADIRGVEVGAVHGVIVGGLVGLAAYGLFFLFLPSDYPWAPVWAGLAVGSVAAVSDVMLIRALSHRAGALGPVTTLIGAMSLTSSLLAVATIGITLATERAVVGEAPVDLSIFEWIGAAIFAGITCGILFILFVGRWGNDQRAFFATIAIVVFSSGIAAGIGISPLFVGLIAGLTASLFSSQADVVADALDRIEQPAFVAILVISGAMFTEPSLMLVGIALALTGARVVAQMIGGFIAPRLVPEAPRPRQLGIALLPQGALGVAIAANFVQLQPQGDLGAQLALTVAFVGLLVADALGANSVRPMLANAGEIRPRATPIAGESA